VIDQISARVDGQATYTSPWSTAFSVGRFDDPDAGYFFSADRKWLFLFVQQRREEGNFTDSRSTIEAIRRTMVALRPDFPGVEAGVTGGPAISNDEMSSAFSDSEVASILASVLTMALLIAAFRSLVSPVLLMGTLTVSLAWSMGIITLVIGHLSIFSVMFISIVVGIGTDYGV
jgi:predicted RND superfamily exporter protein